MQQQDQHTGFRWDRLAVSPMKWWWAPVTYLLSVVLLGVIAPLADLINMPWIGRQGQMIAYATSLPIVLAIFGRGLSKRLGWIGLGGRDLARSIGIGTAYGVACVITVELLQRFGGFGSGGSADLFRQAKVGIDVGQTFSLLAATCLIAPVCEEIFFRAGLFRPIRDAIAGSAGIGSRRTWLAALVGLLVSGLAFLEVHAGSPKILFLYVVLAAFFTAAYLTTSSLTGAVVAHAVNNAIVVTMTLLEVGDLSLWVFALPPLGLALAIAVSVLCGRVLDRPDNDAYPRAA